MSFILDALKKSEAERQRQAGPTLLELRITAPRRRYPVWAIALGALLVLNVVVLLVFLVRRPESPSPAMAAPLAAAPSQPAAGARADAPVVNSPPVVPASAPTVAALSPAAVPQSPLPPPASAIAASPSPSAEAPAPSSPASSSIVIGPGSTNPADQEPALPAAATAPAPLNYGALPSLDELTGDVPSLQLDLLDYSDRANERYALINMHRVHEGDTLPEGATVLAITRDGVALDYRGQNFMLRPGGIH